jgi:hypothetical protein
MAVSKYIGFVFAELGPLGRPSGAGRTNGLGRGVTARAGPAAYAYAGWSRSQRLPYRSSKTATEP